MSDWSPDGLKHGILLDFFVIAPALLGGLGRVLIPREFGCPGMSTPRLDRLALFVLSLGALSLFAGHGARASIFPVCLILWACGMFLLATGTVATILDARPVPFRNLSPFIWSQLLTALGFVVVTPVLAAGMVRLLVSDAYPDASMNSWLHLVQVPELGLSILPALGIVGSIVFYKGRQMHAVLPVVMAVMSVGTAVVWAHGVIDSDLSPVLLEVVGVALPSVFLIAGIVHEFWRARLKSAPALSWAYGSLVLLSAGWVLRLMPDGQNGLHAAALFGAIFALFGGYYRWQDSIPGVAVSHSFARAHLAVTVLGVVCSLVPVTDVRHVGEGVMSLSLLFVFVLAWRLLIPFASCESVKVRS